MAFKLFRKMKVCAQSGYNYKDVPTIMLKGLWLKECGFDFGVPVHVKCENGKLTITREDYEEYSQIITMESVCKVAEETGIYLEKKEQQKGSDRS